MLTQADNGVNKSQASGRNRYPFLGNGCFAALATTGLTGTVDCFVALRAPRNDTDCDCEAMFLADEYFPSLKRAPRNDTDCHCERSEAIWLNDPR